MKKVITIEASPKRGHGLDSQHQLTQRRVAGYARVSTDHDDQTTSYEAQMRYYTQLIESRADWTFVKMYSDEGISGTDTRLRTGFKEMVQDALDGKIDLILTKSVSRFARNTVYSLTTVRQLKDIGVEIYFEKENIWTLDAKGELLITIMSSLAQEESRSISENVTWSLRKQYAEGKVSFPYTNVLGFDKDENGHLVINEEEAKVVRYIFQQTLLGKTPYHISQQLTKQGIPTPMGKGNWSSVTIKRMLRNEKYKGDALLQKTYTTDFLTKKKTINKGELPQHYVENNHEAIIDKETFDLVQNELDKKDKKKGSATPFSTKLICGACGHYFGSKVWHSTSKYRRVIYRCNQKYKGESKCATGHVTEDEVKTWFVSAINQVLTNRDEVISQLNRLLEMMDDSIYDRELQELETEMTIVSEMVDKLIHDNRHYVQDQVAYQREYDQLSQRYHHFEENSDTLRAKQLEVRRQKKALTDFLHQLSQQEQLITVFDERLWESTVDNITIGEDKQVSVSFRHGMTIQL